LGTKASVVGVAIVFATPAFADWQVHSSKDRMTEKSVKYATLSAKAPDHGVSASIELTCDGMDGRRSFTVKLSERMTRGYITGKVRLDEHKVRQLASLRTYADPYRIPLITAPPYDMWGHKRFRIELFPTGSASLFYDFDLTGIDKTISVLPCNRRPAETYEDTMSTYKN
jgi:hypothetical protein